MGFRVYWGYTWVIFYRGYIGDNGKENGNYCIIGLQRGNTFCFSRLCGYPILYTPGN